jgi:G3E family GTPase
MTIGAGPVPTLLVTGYLWVGKTTLLRGWLARKPAGERWAVLVNEFGAVGIDRALLGGGAEVFEVAGGCACCAAGLVFRTTLTRLLRRGPWHRLLIEASGLGHPAQLVDQLREPALQPLLTVLPPIAVVDARRPTLYLDDAHPAHRSARAQVELARVVIINRSSEVDPPALASLSGALVAVPPWPPVLRTTADGRLPFEDVLRALDEAEPGRPPQAGGAGPPMRGPLASDGRVVPPSRRVVPPEERVVPPDGPVAPPGGRVRLPGGGVRWSQGGGGAWSCGWWWPPSRVFDRRRLESVLRSGTEPGGALQARGLLRMKGVFRTERAWYAWQWDDGQQHWSETQWRADNRLEAIALRDFDPQIIDTALDRAGQSSAASTHGGE